MTSPMTLRISIQSLLLAGAIGIPLHAQAASASMTTTSWIGGFEGKVVIAQDGGGPLKDWRLTFTAPFGIGHIWNARIVSHVGNQYVIGPEAFNADIPANGKVDFGFTASGSDLSHSAFVVAAASTPVPPLPPPAVPGGGFVNAHGALNIVNASLVDRNGVPVQLKGMSSHGLHWYPQFVNQSSMKTLRDDWGMTVFRAAMYTAEGGYIDNPAVIDKVYEAIDAAIALNIYVIVDWHILHDNDPNTHKAAAKLFFDKVARRYPNVPNVLYEIANEPNGTVTWRDHIKPYAQEVIPLIRAISPASIVIVGTDTWSQRPDRAALDPLAFANVMYAVHFYACAHKDAERAYVSEAVKKGAAVFASEWGTTDSSGSGQLCLDEAATWLNFFDAQKISWVNWSLTDKVEASAALKNGEGAHGNGDNWTDQRLSPSGKFVKEKMRAGAAAGQFDPAAFYKIVSVSSGKALDIANGALNNGAGLVQRSYTGSEQQQFRILDGGAGYAKIINRRSGKAIEVQGWSASAGGVIDQWDDLSNHNQLWKITAANGSYKLVNKHSAMAVDVPGNSTADGAALIQWPDSGAPNQQWLIVKVQ